MTSCVNIPARPRKAGLLCALLASALCAIARADGADDAYEAAKSAFDAAAYSNAAVAFDLFLAAHPEFSLAPFIHPLTGEATDGTVQFLPWDTDNDAMFAAVLQRAPGRDT